MPDNAFFQPLWCEDLRETFDQHYRLVFLFCFYHCELQNCPWTPAAFRVKIISYCHTVLHLSASTAGHGSSQWCPQFEDNDPQNLYPAKYGILAAENVPYGNYFGMSKLLLFKIQRFQKSFTVVCCKISHSIRKTFFYILENVIPVIESVTIQDLANVQP